MALILRYFTDVVVKKFTFAIASPDEFLLTKALQYRMLAEGNRKSYMIFNWYKNR